ncbi:MAG: hypothetical protein HND27_02260 [Bacteroidetes bacterium]|nr:hypothetical protein [Bacteroidota bacterium]NOG94582.1 hypothetical protein [Bacteroidota bacterium]
MLILIVLIFLHYKIIFHFQKLGNKLIFLYYILFFVLGFGVFAITYILAYSGALPNHYNSEFESKRMNDLALFCGLVSMILCVTGFFTLLFKHLFFRSKNKIKSV